jgi:hypothetical protein
MTNCLHFLASPACAPQYSSYESHVLAVLPSPQVWTPDVQLPTPAMLQSAQPPRCYHSSGATILQCLTCSGTKLDVLNDPDFWDDLRPRKSSRGLKFADLIASKAVWHQKIKLNCN